MVPPPPPPPLLPLLPLLLSDDTRGCLYASHCYLSVRFGRSHAKVVIRHELLEGEPLSSDGFGLPVGTLEEVAHLIEAAWTDGTTDGIADARAFKMYELPDPDEDLRGKATTLCGDDNAPASTALPPSSGAEAASTDSGDVSDELDVPDDLGDAACELDVTGKDDSNNDGSDDGNDAGQLARRRAETVWAARMLTVAQQLQRSKDWYHDVEVPGLPGKVDHSPTYITKAALLRFLRRHDSEMTNDLPTDRLNKIRRCAARAAAAQQGKPCIDGDELALHNDYAFAMQEGAGKDAPSLWIGRLVRMTMRKPDRKAAVRRCPVGLASDLSGLELYCNWYRATARRGEYSLSNAVVDTAAYTVECLLGVVELDYNPDSDIFVIDADQLKALESKCRQTSKTASSQREAAASAAARRAQQHEAEGLQPQQVAVVNRYGRTTTKDAAPVAPAKRPPAATSAGPPGKAPRVERMPASSKAAGKRPTSGTTVVAKPRARDWEPTGWAARKEPLRSESVQRHYTLLMEAGGDWRNPLPQADGSSLVLRMRVVDECNAVPFSGQLVAWAAALGFNVVDNSRGGRQIGGTECGIIAAFNCVALAEAGDSWCTLPAASLGASASQLQLKWAADRAAQWAAAGQRHNTLVRYLAESEVSRLVRVIATDRGVQRVTTGSVDVLLFPKDLFLLKVIRDVHHGGPLQRFCIVNNMDCDQRGQHFISVVYSVTPLQQRPPRQQQEKIEHLDLALADIGSKEYVV